MHLYAAVVARSLSQPMIKASKSSKTKKTTITLILNPASSNANVDDSGG